MSGSTPATSGATSPPGKNQRRPHLREALQRVAVRFWFGRDVYLTAIGYVFLLSFFWINVATLESGSAVSDWSPPGEGHLFGVNEKGQDVFHLSLAAGAQSMSLAMLAVVFGVIGSILVGWLIALSRESLRGFGIMRAVTRFGKFVPALLLILILCAGWGGGFWKLFVLFSFVIFAASLGRVSEWFEELEGRGDNIAATVLGLTRAQTILQNHILFIAKRGTALACGLIPGVVLGETALSFIGLGLGSESWGSMLGEGMAVLFEAPWLTIYPGLVATLSLIALSALSWMARRSMKGDIPPRLF